MKTIWTTLLCLAPLAAAAQAPTPSAPAKPLPPLPGVPTKVAPIDTPIDAMLDDGAQIVSFSQQYGNLFFVLSYKGKYLTCSVYVRLPEASSACLRMN